MTHSLTTDKTAVDEQVFSHCCPLNIVGTLLTSRFSHISIGSGPDGFGPEINTTITSRWDTYMYGAWYTINKRV